MESTISTQDLKAKLDRKEGIKVVEVPLVSAHPVRLPRWHAEWPSPSPHRGRKLPDHAHVHLVEALLHPP